MTTVPGVERGRRERGRIVGHDELIAELLTVAETPELLVGMDYDGTLAEIVDDPMRAHPDAESIRLLVELSALPHTHVAIVSGRARAELVKLTGLRDGVAEVPTRRDDDYEIRHTIDAAGDWATDGVHLIGSHGSEPDADWADEIPVGVAVLREEIALELERIASSLPGSWVEHKPTSAALHYRTCDPKPAAKAIAAARSLPERIDELRGAIVKNGKCVVELCALPIDKGWALARLMARLHASATVFVGDDDTDEDAFAVLSDHDLGVKVGDGATRASLRIADVVSVELLLAHLLQLRTAHLMGSADT
jgi:trehalose 6-phosphate phosphatase